MKLQFKLSILIALTIIMLSVSLTQAEVPVYIGSSPQQVPYESNPTAAITFGNYVASPTATALVPASGRISVSGAASARDGDLGTYATLTMTATAGHNGIFDVKTFDTDATEPAITQVDLRIKYQYTASNPQANFQYNITCDLGSGTVNTLVASTGTTAALGIYKWDSFTKPGGGDWDWASIATLRIRFGLKRLATTSPNTAPTYRVYEVWLKVTCDGAPKLPKPGTNPATQAYDGQIDLAALFGGLRETTGYFSLNTFTNTPTNTFDIGFVDFKARLAYTATPDTVSTGDQYRLVYYVGGNGPIVLSDWSNASYSVTPSTLAQTWFNQAEPNDDAWSWDDIASVDVRLETQVIGDEDYTTLSIYEAWLSVYPAEFPPTSSTTISVWPPVIDSLGIGDRFFVDIYIRNPLGPKGGVAGWQFYLGYDPITLNAINPLTAPDFGFTYWPLTDPAPYEFGTGYVSTGASLPTGSPFFTGGYNGTNNGFPCARIYFEVLAGGTSALTFDTSKTFIVDPAGNFMDFTAHDGFYGGVPEFPLGLGLLMVFVPLAPIVYIWRLRKKSR